jgi:ABC-type phosphate transport system ATPase subunit
MLRLKSELALVLVTHDLEQALRVSDCVAFTKSGSIVRWGAAEEVLSGSRGCVFRTAWPGGDGEARC